VLAWMKWEPGNRASKNMNNGKRNGSGSVAILFYILVFQYLFFLRARNRNFEKQENNGFVFENERILGVLRSDKLENNLNNNTKTY